MDRYFLFQQLLTLLAEDYSITNAQMKNYSDRITIEAMCPGGEIKLEVAITEGEDKNDDNS